MNQFEVLKRKLKEGSVYRRADLEKLSTAVDRHLQELVKEGVVEKLSGGLYYVPKQGDFGKVPAADNELIKAFLKDPRFVVTSPNDYNALGVGTTQLYNIRKVYNFKRHGNFRLGNRSFRFIRKSFVPDKVSKEFLMIDLVNNLKHLAEDESAVINKVTEKIEFMNKSKLEYYAELFGTVRTRKIFKSLLQK